MLLKIFAAIGAGGSVLHTLLAGQTGNALETTGILLLRFLEYFFGAHIAYVLVMLLSTELFIRKSKPQEKPSCDLFGGVLPALPGGLESDELLLIGLILLLARSGEGSDVLPWLALLLFCK